jgi:mono/diheme cytochrome c family protein
MLVLLGLFTNGLLRAADPLVWRAEPAQFTVEDSSLAEIRITLRNDTTEPVTITEIQPSCGCTVVDGPALPWTLARQSSGTFLARVDLRGKSGRLHKTISLVTSAGAMSRPVEIHIPAPPLSASRQQNLLVALADARTLFQGHCARCHAEPALNKTGAELYAAVCAICHEAHPRADAVPDLAVAGRGQPAEYWRFWITEGKAGTVMPAFARAQGGILDQAQIESLVEFLRKRD